ncbi:hypothetical protein L6164_031574 [Bauhinia variegata]|uniref:Uncharacterized protein n=1 Tax=Bauhinia variegata TaxID=167791 RepID=A0ACB9LFV4_BAUVA|nr:hypothetical protein L6164_031574 [Bauhinia variegata]
MSSSSSASSSSSSSSTSTDDIGNGVAAPGPSTRRTSDFEGPSSSRLRAMNEVWPAPFLEALATQVAIEAAQSQGRLFVAPALANVFQVCSTWRAASRSDPLWQRLTEHIWRRTHLIRDTWHDEFIYWHRAAANFHRGNSSYTTLHFDPSDTDGDPDSLTCRCLTLSDHYLACGFADGTVRLFDLGTGFHVSTFRSHLRNRLGRFSRAVSGIIMTGTQLVFASLDGDICVAILDGPAQHPRRARTGDVVTNGALVEFAGCRRRWVGLFAGVPGRAIHIWDAQTEEPVFIGGTLTDPEAVMGWHMLTEVTDPVGRLRVTTQETAVACTSSRLIVFDLANPDPENIGFLLHELEPTTGFIVTSLDVSHNAFIIVDNFGWATVRRASTLEFLCRRFSTRSPNAGASTSTPIRTKFMACMNLGHALTTTGGVIRVWEVEHGAYLYRLNRDRISEPNAMVANERHVAIASSDTSIHLWDFGVQ